MGLRSPDLGRLVVELSLLKLAGNAALFAEGDVKGGNDLSMFVLMVAMLGGLFYFMILRPQRREQARRVDMLSAIKKNDRVVTIGGLYGVVANVNREADEVTLKVDETTNTKLRVTLSSVARVLGDEPADESVKK